MVCIKKFYKIGHGMCNNNNKKAHEYLDGVRKRDVSDWKKNGRHKHKKIHNFEKREE